MTKIWKIENEITELNVNLLRRKSTHKIEILSSSIAFDSYNDQTGPTFYLLNASDIVLLIDFDDTRNTISFDAIDLKGFLDRHTASSTRARIQIAKRMLLNTIDQVMPSDGT